MRRILYIILHCSAGFGLIPIMQSYWHTPKTKGGLGWKNPGYHIIIYPNGERWYVTRSGGYSKDINDWYPQLITNGVGGFNSNSIHICYVGGINPETKKAKDTRTPEQKESILDAFGEIYTFLTPHQEVDEILIRGHRDFSPDIDRDGKVTQREWLKECPSFDVLEEYWWVQGAKAINKGRTTFA